MKKKITKSKQPGKNLRDYTHRGPAKTPVWTGRNAGQTEPFSLKFLWKLFNFMLAHLVPLSSVLALFGRKI